MAAAIFIEGLDHVAVVVRDMAASIAWYKRVLGLERRHANVWGELPAMLVAPGAARSGLALFPLCGDKPAHLPQRWTSLALDHVAFRVDRVNFEAARGRLGDHGIAFEFEDHTVAHSIYFNDPDGHRVELTTYEVGS